MHFDDLLSKKSANLADNYLFVNIRMTSKHIFFNFKTKNIYFCLGTVKKEMVNLNEFEELTFSIFPF